MTLTPASHLTRRRAIRIVAGAAGVLGLGATVRALAPQPRFFRWQGSVLDSVAEIALWGADETLAKNTIAKISSEIARYHRIFSLFDPASEISRLNRDGVISKASSELRELVAESVRLGELSDGAFDITVQPIWRVYEAHFWTKANPTPDISARALEAARTLVGYRAIHIGGRDIAFAKPGMAITLNGIAQGYITDKIADLLRNEGFDCAFLDLGEMRALGDHPEGRPWAVDLKNPQRPDMIGRSVSLSQSALAVSGGYGTKFEPTGHFHHIFDPRTGDSARKFLDVAVMGPRATAADGLSTAIYVAGEATAPRLLAAYPGYRALATRADATRLAIDPA